jgi:hypothetical protein
MTFTGTPGPEESRRVATVEYHVPDRSIGPDVTDLNDVERRLRRTASRRGVTLPLGPMEAVGRTCCPGWTVFRLKGWK